MLTKDIQNERGSIDHLKLEPYSTLDIGLLRGTEFIVKYDDVSLEALSELSKLLNLAASDKCAWYGTIKALHEPAHRRGTIRFSETLELVHGRFDIPLPYAAINSDEHSSLGRHIRRNRTLCWHNALPSRAARLKRHE